MRGNHDKRIAFAMDCAAFGMVWVFCDGFVCHQQEGRT